MPDSYSIRPIARQDYDQWLPLWLGYNAFYGRAGATALPAEIVATTWARFFDAYEPVHALVADVDGQLLGLTHYLFHRSTITTEPSCYLQDLFTSEPARGRGVGRALIEGVYAQAAAAGAGRVYWQTHETNHTAMKLYDQVADKSGFLVYRKMFERLPSVEARRDHADDGHRQQSGGDPLGAGDAAAR
ncbi:MAG TPA: GNAT family N-acetyltransferase [Aliidongia sp.]|uniref:GNAT family N-acetyltransferase n=1 Tax=Aliidongia sp. TaxID=1914230 RepID=UPI002DDD456E|nr:GNAT family N-acetyltransferase [Aliidongia sp.]HEV2678339.1 GNAT family N-acetyltransferase [Aliidongia sp.]